MNFEGYPCSWIKEVLQINQENLFSFFNQIQTDSRKIKPGDLFVPLKGDSFDGHDFIQQAIKAGATGVLTELPFSSSEVDVFEVKDTLKAYEALGVSWRKKFNLPMISIIGSVGKTTTKEMIASFLQAKFQFVHKTIGSQNGMIGIPMTLLEIRKHHQCSIVEIGIDSIGTMKKHIQNVSPTHLLMTTLGPEHLEFLKDIETVVSEEWSGIQEATKQGATTIVNLSDPLQAPLIQNEQTYGFEKQATVYSQIEEGHLLIETKKQKFKVPLLLEGLHHALNQTGAIAATLEVGLQPEDFQKGASLFSPAEGRAQMKELNGIQFYCDYYNANPTSMLAAIKTLQSHKNRQWYVLGDMLELGPKEVVFHENLAQPIIDANPYGVYLHGPLMKSLYDKLKKKGFSGEIEFFENREKLAKQLILKIKNGDLIFLKGSRGRKIREVWYFLESHFKTLSS
tara:strand:- start:12572 stop:13930 length:1359 start_codon:yes stop_codon:yes gene_type:complete